MAQFNPVPAYARLEDQLDAVGQRVRGQRIVGGAAWFVAVAVAATWAAALGAHATGTGRWAEAISAAWAVVLAAAAAAWVILPLLMRVPALRVARMLESRVPGLHNGLTNAVLLARADDLRTARTCRPSSTR